MTEKQARQKIVDIMRGWIGLKEGDGSHMKILIIYNSHTPLARGYRMTETDPWCAATVSAAAISAGYTDIIPTDCSCSAMISKLKDMRIWQENDAHVPAPGDLIFYDWQDSGKGDNTGAPDHVGLVEKVSGKTITVIEGNYHDSVKRRTIQVDSRYIRGYGIPDYAGIATSIVSPKIAISVAAQQVFNGLWGNGQTRKDRLAAAGYTPDEMSAIQHLANLLCVDGWTVRVCVQSVLKIRSGAGTPCHIEGKLPNGAIVTIKEVRPGIGSDDGWGRIEYGGKAGWIALDWVATV